MNSLTAPAISARGLCYAYGERVALHEACLDLEPGSVTGIAGPNGSGKSTLIELLAGVRTPHRGSIRRLGSVSLVVQRPAVPETLPLTVRDTVSMGTWGRRVGRRQARKTVSEMIDTVGLAGLDYRPLTELSGGQRQRAFLAQALASSADIVLMDEPDTGLDTASRLRIHELLVNQAADRGAAVGFATHDENFLAAADHVVLLDVAQHHPGEPASSAHPRGRG